MAGPDRPLFLICGIGPFERFAFNPRGEVARSLAARPPKGMRIRARVLPASFARAPAAWDELIDSRGRPALFVGLGVASRRRSFSLERLAKPQLRLVPRPDVDGRCAREFSARGPGLETRIDLARVLAALRRHGVRNARISERAGGYVCERVYHHILTRAGEQGVPGLFVHVPPLRFARLARQVQVVTWVLEEILRSR